MTTAAVPPPVESPPLSPLRELLSLALPTILQMASYTLMQFVDVWILARAGLGDIAPTAATQAGMIAFSVISLGMGVEFVVNTFVSQSFGRGDHRAAGQYLWQGIWFALGYSLLVLPLILFARGIFLRFGHDAELAGLEGAYLRIVMMAAVLKLTAVAVEQFLLAVNRPNAVAVASFIAVAVNAVTAWFLVKVRHGGVPASAVAQNVGVGVELLVVCGMALQPSIRREFASTDFRFRPAAFAELIKIGIPSGVQIVAEVGAWCAFTVWVIAAFHADAMAANVYVFKYMSVSFMPAFGMSVAVTALVGRYTGMGRPDTARARAHLGFFVTAVYMVGCGIILFSFRGPLMRLFTADCWSSPPSTSSSTPCTSFTTEPSAVSVTRWSPRW
jgi:MATE family multidrug resistance protein